jgi:hypothetical protein
MEKEMREIKFRAWHKGHSTMYPVLKIDLRSKEDTIILEVKSEIGYIIATNKQCEIMQYTGLKDKNGLKDIYECDIIGVGGLIRGNKYENPELLQDTTNLVIEGFGTKSWWITYKEAMARGCQDSE